MAENGSEPSLAGGLVTAGVLELGATVLLAVAAVATAWSSYQASRWMVSSRSRSAPRTPHA